MRRHRERERLGVRLVEIEVTPELISDLVDVGALDLSEIEDGDALRRAILDIAGRAVQEAKPSEWDRREEGGAERGAPMHCARVRLDRG
jgi:hypothetical protein